MSSCNGLYRPSRSASLPLSLPFFFPGYSASVPSAFASVPVLSRSAPFPSAHPFGLASVSQLSTFRFLAAAFFFHSFELLFSAFRLSLFRASSRLRFLPFRAFPRSFGLLLTYSYLFPFRFPFRFRFRSGFPLSLPASASFSFELSACLLFRSFELLFRPAVSLPFRAYLRFRFFSLALPFFLPLCLSASLPFFSFPPFSFLPWLSSLSSFCLPSSILSNFLTAPVSFLSDFLPVFWASLPSLPASFSFELSACLLFCSFELLFRPAVSLLFRAYLRFRFFGFGIPFVLPLPLSVLLPFSQLSAFASCCGFLFPLFLASYFCLPSLFPFGLPYGPGFFPFGLSRRSFGLCPPLFPFSFRSAFRLRFRFWLSAFASCPGLLLFRAFCPAFFSALSNFFSGLPSFRSFKLPYGLGFWVFQDFFKP